MQSRNSLKFELRFDSAALPELANRYSFQDDADALTAGSLIRENQYSEPISKEFLNGKQVAGADHGWPKTLMTKLLIH